MAKEKTEIVYCVKEQIWKKGFLRKTLNKELFKKLEDAERYYNGCEKPGTVVQLSKYVDGNEREIKRKNN